MSNDALAHVMRFTAPSDTAGAAQLSRDGGVGAPLLRFDMIARRCERGSMDFEATRGFGKLRDIRSAP